MQLQPSNLGSGSTNHALIQPKSWQHQRYHRKLGFNHLQQPHSESNMALTTRLHPLVDMEGAEQTHLSLQALPSRGNLEISRQSHQRNNSEQELATSG